MSMSKYVSFLIITTTLQLNSVQMPISSSPKPLSLEQKKQAICEQAQAIQAYARTVQDCRSIDQVIDMLDASITLFEEADTDRSDILTDRQVWEHLMTTERTIANAYQVTIQANAQHIFKDLKAISDLSIEIESTQQALCFARDSKYFLCLINAVKMNHSCVRNAIKMGIISDPRVANMLRSLSDSLAFADQLVAANFFEGVVTANSICQQSNR
ncbi:hypothetical protein KJZ61_00365 [Candidatus Dependentiae bacterium]|nr:hypothetical protein [Candidatus Dependentiae bacterium]